MKRKLVSQGHSTMTISLPARWVKTFGLKAGDEVDMLEQNPGVLIMPPGQRAVARASLNAKGMGRLLVRALSALYRKGYDEVDVVIENADQLQLVQETINRGLVGFEIDQVGKTSCHIKNISGSLDPEFDPLLRRVFFLLNTMGQESVEVIQSKKFDDLNSVIAAEEMNNRFTTICRRIINRQGGNPFLYCLVEQLEKIADEYRDVLLYVKSTKKFSKEDFALYTQATELVKLLSDCFYAFENQKAIRVNEERVRLTKDINARFDKGNGKILHHVQNLVDFSGNALSMMLALRL
ncbi:hypothetical protein HY489_05935 [Candidatus Woesearchaeota archaeon]|nr:hypothetical protein [Candidatus Woesearchaeota archaeon]